MSVVNTAGIDNFLGSRQFADDPLAGIKASVRPPEIESKSSVDSQIDFAVDAVVAFRPPPAFDLSRIGPGPKDQIARYVEGARNEDLTRMR